jgi:hypothetical protein
LHSSLTIGEDDVVPDIWIAPVVAVDSIHAVTGNCVAGNPASAMAQADSVSPVVGNGIPED